ncbi:hypothetical protein NE237_024824 [Protea cynaroides]|uniref:Uncharacterized protein n=1 Tax=Protea cynaroides TaxID=273540 RepID=A0A9Q0H3Q9_9MAGN|nr:hypothetical protein NE237_024824 [Protea cynaroides]
MAQSCMRFQRLRSENQTSFSSHQKRATGRRRRITAGRSRRKLGFSNSKMSQHESTLDPAYVITYDLPSSSLSFLLNKIIGFCALSPLGDIDHARRVFHHIRKPNIFCWNSMISSRNPI